jgi:exosortase
MNGITSERPRTDVPAKISAVLVVVAIVWGGLIYKLTTDWSTNPQYQFGYFVPVFIGYLTFRRWGDRPQPSAEVSKPTVWFVSAILLCGFLPLRIIQEANPDWRPLNWIHAAAVVAFTLAVVTLVGGSVWAKHFCLPLLLIFFSLPWPLAAEQTMIKELTGTVTRATVEILNWFNIPALQRGNVIEVASGSVGVADACSGMRSLAGTLMASAFFGEFYRGSWLSRVMLLVGGSAIAFGLNIIRTFFLGWRTASEGGGAVEAWHDPAGYTIFLVSFAALWLLAKLIIAEEPGKSSSAHIGKQMNKISWSAIAIALTWLVSSHMITEGWYRLRETPGIASKQWTIKWPEESAEVRYSELSDDARSILRYTEGVSAMIDWPDGRVWQMIVLQWDPGRSSAQLATMHRPDICMPAAGFRLISTAPPVHLKSAGVELVFDGSVFDSHGAAVYVYRCLWEQLLNDEGGKGRSFDMSFSGRLMSSWSGRRNLGQRLVQIAVSGVNSEEQARSEIERKFPGFVIVGI